MESWMKRTAKAATWPLAALLLTAAATGCSSDGKTSSAAPTTASATASSAASSPATAAPVASVGTASVSTKSAGSLGTILVDSKGRTLYLFQADQKNKSNCSGACLAAWPPLVTNGAAKATGSAKSSMLATTTRAGGVTQVTYNGHPLYYYVGDTKTGSTNGQGLNQFGALWYVVDPAGKAITKS
jgi:predicted lipoprotein with Yx(FWY)xxD motif